MVLPYVAQGAQRINVDCESAGICISFGKCIPGWNMSFSSSLSTTLSEQKQVEIDRVT